VGSAPGSARERGDASTLGREQMHDQVGLAVRHTRQDERACADERLTRAPRHDRAQETFCSVLRESSWGISPPRGLSTMLSARVKRMSKSTNAMATPTRRPRAGLAVVLRGSGVAHAARRLDV